MDRYARIDTKLPREFVLLQGTGCRWRKCTFCDYHTDVSAEPYAVNQEVLHQVTGAHGVLDVINSGSCIELDVQTLELIKQVVAEKNIHTLWFESHYIYRNRLAEFAAMFPSVEVKFRCGVETFQSRMRQKWNKGIPTDVTPADIAKHFKGVCLLCCVEGQTREDILNDIAVARKYFEYFSVNVFCDNTTSVRRDERLVEWFRTEVYPSIKDELRIEVLIDNTDLGVG